MNKKVVALAGAAVALSLLLGIGFQLKNAPRDIVAEDNPFVEIENSYADVSQIYRAEYQKGIKSQVEALKKQEADFTKPLLIANPYSTNTTGVYVYFSTKKASKITYTVTTEGAEDFSRTLYNGGKDNLSKEHEYMLIGCVPDQLNTITLRAEDEKGKAQGSYTFTYQAPSLLNQQNEPRAIIDKGESTKPLSNGLYTVLGNDASEEEMEEDFIGMYDNEGVIRCEIPIVNFRAHDLIFDEQGMYYSITSTAIACLDRTGYVTRVYDTGDFKLHHEYIFGSKNDMLVLASETDADTKDDRIISIDLESGAVTEVVDLQEVFPNYKNMATQAEGTDYLDWMHINSMELIGEDSIVISSRDTSTIIALDDIYNEPKARYLIGSPNFWSGTGYEELLLKQKGEFSLQGGQHSVLYVPDESLPQGQYYLMLYNNNNTYSFARKEYDWMADDNYYNTGVANDSKGNSSYYYKYLIDEKERTFTLVDSIPVGYSGFVSSVQEVQGNIVIDSGGIFTTYEFDEDGILIQQLTYGGEKWIYRTKKYEYKNYWFF